MLLIPLKGCIFNLPGGILNFSTYIIPSWHNVSTKTQDADFMGNKICSQKICRREGSVFTRWSINAVSPSPHKIIEHGSIETIELNMTHHDSV